MLKTGSVLMIIVHAHAQSQPEWDVVMQPNLAGRTARPLRYWPAGTDFVITNGGEFFNRPLYCLNSAFRVDGGDIPEFSIYLPGRGGNLRLGIKTIAGVKWAHEMQTVVARYRPGSLNYEIRDALFGEGELRVSALPMHKKKGLVVRVEFVGSATQPVELVWAFGGANGMRGRRGGDIGCEREPVNRFFQLRPEQCRDNQVSIRTNVAVLSSRVATLACIGPVGAQLAVADATKWAAANVLLESVGQHTDTPVLVGRVLLQPAQPVYLAVQQITSGERSDDSALGEAYNPVELADVFTRAEQHRRAIAGRVAVDTPDSFINAAVAALCVAADAIWDEQQGAFMHGAVAWRSKLLGWRGPYAGDALGWHDRARRHFSYWASQQVTNPVPEKLPPPDPDSNLSRCEAALHSNGALSKSHYDMNLVYIDALFRHLLWTGDLEFARSLWPVIERHFAWEQRLFRRPFGNGNMPLYEAYAAIWASDDLQYHGGGVTYTSAYNYWHNKMAARLARILGYDAAPYEREAELIRAAMHTLLWLEDRGWFAEYKDWLGKQLVHPNCGVWTVYHTIDSEAATPMQAWQMTRYLDTQIPHIPIHGPNVPGEDLFTVSTTTWMPYSWSVNNVVMAEALHTALAYWQANRPGVANRLFKGALLDSMFMGLCPGNLGMTTPLDVARREAQRDFADAVGVCARAVVEGLFGIRPDALAGELLIRPGWPTHWQHARIRHPDFDFAFERTGLTEKYAVQLRFGQPLTLRLHAPALRDQINSVTVNGKSAKWRSLDESVELPRIEIVSPRQTEHTIVITWRGQTTKTVHVEPRAVALGDKLDVMLDEVRPSEVADPQKTLANLRCNRNGFSAMVTGQVGHRTVFAKVKQGKLNWWTPLTFEIRRTGDQTVTARTDWKAPLPHSTKLEPVDLSAFFNDSVTQIFRNEYLSPRPPSCSLAIPKQGIGSWCRYQEQFDVDDSGLRAAAARCGGMFLMPNGVPFQTPTNLNAKNVIFTSQWDNYPNEVTVPLRGRARRIYLLMAGSTNPMQSRFDNGEVLVRYADGSTARLPLHNPTTWWPIDQDYFIDDYAFHRPEPIPPRVDLLTGTVRLLDVETFKGKGGKVHGGAATVLELGLDQTKELAGLTVRALANEVVIGLMAATLLRE